MTMRSPRMKHASSVCQSVGMLHEIMELMKLYPHKAGGPGYWQ
jgi:hypothetical protein